MDDVIILGKLEDKELKTAIDNLVNDVADKSQTMANKFEKAMDIMKNAMKDFAITQNVSVKLMKDAWREMSASFDAMVRAQEQQKAKASGTSSSPAADTVAALRAEIKGYEMVREELRLGTAELRDQNQIIAGKKAQLKEELKTEQQITEERKKQAKNDFKIKLGTASKLDEKNVESATKKLREMLSIRREMQNLQKNNGVFFNTKEMADVESKIQRLIDKIRKYKETAQKGKPLTMNDVLGMSENSVDAIVKKMAALKKVQIDPHSSEQVKKLNDEYQRLRKLQRELMGQNIQLANSNNILGNAFGYLRNRIIYALTLGAASNFVKQMYEVRGQYELLERSLGVLVNSFERGSQIFQELNAMAIKSPFTLIELATAAKQLTAYNFAADEVVDTTRRLADISSALGVPMERLTYNLGQIRAQTVLTARDARDFANAGLPIVKSLSEYYTELEGKVVSTGDVYDRMSKKMVSYTDVMAVLNKMTDEGGKFFDFQAKQAETLRVQMANLSLAFNNTLNDIGKEKQSLLSTPLKLLKSLLENWRAIERAIWDVIHVLSVYKLSSLVIALVSQIEPLEGITGAFSKMVDGGNKMIGVLKSIGLAMASAFMNPVTWIGALLFALFDVKQQITEEYKKTKELNDEIKKGAQEASANIGKFLKANSTIRESLSNGKLTSEQAAKAWSAISDEIETSAASSNSLIAELMQIDDVTERVRRGFRFLEVIQESQDALEKLKDTTISISQTIAGGLFGEGLADDLKDYINAIEKLNNRQAKGQRTIYDERDVYQTTKELEYELTKVANQIKNFISANGIHDPLQINEIVERIRNTIKMNNPKIQGELERVFDINLDDVLSRQLGGFDKTKSITKHFVDDLKKGYSSAFGGLTDEMYESTFTWNATQKKAIDDTLEKYKGTMPEYYDEAVKLVNDISKLKAYVGIAFNINQLPEFQKDFKERIGANWELRQFMPQATDDLPKWVDTMQTAISNLEAKEKIYRRDREKYSQRQLQDVTDEISLRKQALDLYHQSYYKEKKTSGKSEKDELGEALKQELSLIKDMQSNYEKLRKEGVGDLEAINIAAQGYEVTLKRVNDVLSRYGVGRFDASTFAGKNVKEMLQFLTEQRDTLSRNPNVKTSTLEALDVEIQKLNVDAKTYDLKKVTDGLNNQLSKIDEQYELAVQLQANPELGDMFTNMLGIDASGFPQTINEYVDAYNKAVDDALSKAAPNLAIGDIITTDLKEWATKNGQDVGGALVKGLESAQKQAKSQLQSWIKETVTQTKQLQSELGTVEEKIAIKNNELQNLLQQQERETNEVRKRMLGLQIKQTEDAIEKLKNDAVKLMPFYTRLFSDTYNMSTRTLKSIVDDTRKVMDNAQLVNVNGKDMYQISETFIDKDGNEQVKKTVITLEEYISIMKKINELNDQITKSSPWKKISDAFKKGNWEDALSGIADEMTKLSDGVREVGNIAESLGANEETVEILNDVAATIDGCATAAKGVAQISQGDVIGGTVNLIKGAWDAISSWFDNSDKRITRQVEKSERSVKSLQLAYENLQRAVEKSMGAQEIAARKAAIANKQAQLAELQNQLRLEESRKKKNQDEDKILDLRSSINSLRNEIDDMVSDVADTILGSDIKSAAEDFVSTWVSAWRQGEDTMAALEGRFDDMIDNMILKSVASKLVANRLQNVFKAIDNATSDWSQGGSEITMNELAELRSMIGNQSLAEQINEDLTRLYNALGIAYGVDKNIEDKGSNLSSLQQGIQGITETTANALEAYMNGVSQQVYLQSEVLMEIRDTLRMFDSDILLANNSQMLLQLQQSYLVQVAIQGILTGWSNPSGNAVQVSLIN